MRSLLEQLPDDHSVLLMYLADELPAGDRELVENRLNKDSEFRAALENLRDTQEQIAAELGAVDRAHPAAAREQSALRQTCRQIRQWQTDRAREAAAAAPAQTSRGLWWLYPAAAGVAAILIYTIWWGFQPADPSTLRNAPGPQVNNIPLPPWREDMGRPYNPTDTAWLDDAEQELGEIRVLRMMNQPEDQEPVI
jgi:hypothetical protein